MKSGNIRRNHSNLLLYYRRYGASQNCARSIALLHHAKERIDLYTVDYTDSDIRFLVISCHSSRSGIIAGFSTSATSIQTVQPIILTRVAFIHAFTDILLQIGAPVERDLQHAGLPPLLELSPKSYFPQRPVVKFLHYCANQQGIDDFGFVVSQQAILNRFSEQFTTLSLSAPTLYSQLQQVCALMPSQNSSCRMSLSLEGDHVRVCTNLAGLSEREDMRYSEWIRIMVIIEVIKKTVGDNWRPAEITFQSNSKPHDHAFEQFPETRFYFAQKNTSLTLPVSLMCHTLGHFKKDCQTSDSPLCFPHPLDFPSSLKLVLRGCLQQGYPDINLAATIASTSVRTLQRRLAQFGLSYSNLVQQARFEAAEELMRDPALKLLDIAHAIGFDDPSNFSRSFRSIAGVSPQHYRRQKLINEGSAASTL